MATSDILDAKRELSDRLLFGARSRPTGASLRRGFPRHVREAVSDAARNVNAVGVGRKLVDGRPTGERCVRLYVTRKLPKSLLPRRTLLPSSVEGVPTDVIESPPAFATFAASTPACTTSRRKRQRPVRGGISAGHVNVTAGTIACFARSTAEEEDRRMLLVLSNNHVFADVGAADVGDELIQPASLDGGLAKDRIATLLRAVPIDLDGGPNGVDAAVGRLNPRIRASLEICSIGTVTGTSAAKERQTVRKHGRTTGLTFGVVSDVAVDAVVGMDHDDPSINAIFVNQLRIEVVAPSTAFGLGGDSGSLVMTRRGRRAVGLYFAGPASGSYGLANPIERVLEALEIRLAR